MFSIKLCLSLLMLIVNVNLINANTGSGYYMSYGFVDEYFDSDWEKDAAIAQLEAVVDVETSVKFILFTRTKVMKEITMLGIKERTKAMVEFAQNFNPNLDTKIFVHGWKSNILISAANGIIEAYHSNRNCNVIALDWGNLAGSNYISAVGYTSGIGKFLASMIDFLVENQRTTLDKIHIIGHSMGAHIAGFAGSFIKRGKIERISGLDPAYPLFSSLSNYYHLDKSDAKFVDVIHTSAGTLGFKDPIGHIDFYPNGGSATQPGCNGFAERLGNICSHSRACDYFVESIINPRAFFCFKCNSWSNFQSNRCDTEAINMGDSTPKTARGKYYLATNANTPFSKNLVNLY